MDTPRPTVSPENTKVSKDVVFVLGAGVDRVLELPLLNTLFRDLNQFVAGPGAAVNKAIRNHVKNLRFNLQTYGGDEAENLGQKLLGTHPHLLDQILKSLDRHPDAESAKVSAIKTLLTKLSHIAGENALDQATSVQLSLLAGEKNVGDGDTLLDTNHISFRPTVRQAMKTLFAQVSGEIPNLTREEQAAFAEVVTLLANFEELMAMLFVGYFTKHIPDQKKYFYMAWLLWAYIRHREDVGRSKRDASFYKTLSDIGPGGGIITFNYTDFFYGNERPQNGHFHGDCKSFIRFRTREYVTNNIQIKDANTLDRMVDFINGLQIDWTTDPPEVSLPAIIPPLAMKPIICSEYLERWYECAQTIKKAKTIVIVGYSFGVADEHINDLIRKGNKEAKLIVVDPGFDAVITRVCQIVSHDKNALKASNVQGFKCKTGGRLIFIKAKAEEISSAKLLRLLE
jgi:hypothetical protein